ncbi:unnamed protein product [Brachionus calyciflorus]|uniref:Uncharacterized protein n=1 Tax=Brachionus calyciflorus TaxID=104777 RepID=A0A814CF46_9BILA|nr:unnamed protein product [Brachionus calyciflorus]
MQQNQHQQQSILRKPNSSQENSPDHHPHHSQIGFYHTQNSRASDGKFMSREQVLISTTDSISDGIGWCGFILLFLSYVLIVVTVPFSLTVCLKVVQEYERAVMFRLGRILPGGAKGPVKSQNE